MSAHEENVLRFDVAMDESKTVGVTQCIRHFPDDLDRFGDGQLVFTSQPVAQRLAGTYGMT